MKRSRSEAPRIRDDDEMLEEEEEEEPATSRRRVSVFSPHLHGAHFGIHSASQPGIVVDTIAGARYAPIDGYIRDRSNGELHPDQVGLQPGNSLEQQMEQDYEALLMAHPDYDFLSQCVGASTRQLVDFATFKDVVRDRVLAVQYKRAQKIQQKRLEASLPSRLASREIIAARYRFLSHIEAVIDAEVRGPARKWLDSDASATSMALWTRLLGQPGDTHEFHALLFPFYKQWEYTFIDTRILLPGAMGPVTAEDVATVADIVAMDRALFGDTLVPLNVMAGDAPDVWRSKVLKYVLWRDVYGRHLLRVQQSDTRITNRQWLDNVLIETLRRGIVSLPGFTRTNELPLDGAPQRLAAPIDMTVGAGGLDLNVRRFFDALSLFGDTTRPDPANAPAVVGAEWQMGMGVLPHPPWLDRVMGGRDPRNLEPGEPAIAPLVLDGDTAYSQPELALLSVGATRALAMATLFSDTPYLQTASTEPRLMAHAIAPSLFEWTRACTWLERILSPVVVAALADMAQQPGWREDHGLVVLPQLEAAAAATFAPNPAVYYVQYFMGEAVVKARVTALGDMLAYMHHLQPLVVRPTPADLYTVPATMVPAAAADAATTAMLQTLLPQRGSLNYYRRNTWRTVLDVADNAAGGAIGRGLFLDDAPRPVGDARINPRMIEVKYLPFLFGDASRILKEHMERDGHWFHVGGALEPFAPRATHGHLIPVAAAAGAGPPALDDADQVWAEVIRTLRNPNPPPPPPRVPGGPPPVEAVSALDVYRVAGRLPPGMDPTTGLPLLPPAVPVAPVPPARPSLGIAWHMVTTPEWQTKGTPLVALALHWHYVRLLYERDEARHRAADLVDARALLDNIEREITLAQHAATKAALDHAAPASSADILELANKLYVADPATMSLPRVSGRAIFTPFFRKALDDLEGMVQDTLGYPAVTLDMLTSHDARYRTLRRAAVNFVAACAANSSMTFPSGYNKDRQFGVAPALMTAAIHQLRTALLGHGQPAVLGLAPRRLLFI
jgi:hypothetical protein